MIKKSHSLSFAIETLASLETFDLRYLITGGS